MEHVSINTHAELFSCFMNCLALQTIPTHTNSCYVNMIHASCFLNWNIIGWFTGTEAASDLLFTLSPKEIHLVFGECGISLQKLLKLAFYGHI